MVVSSIRYRNCFAAYTSSVVTERTLDVAYVSEAFFAIATYPMSGDRHDEDQVIALGNGDCVLVRKFCKKRSEIVWMLCFV